jgi:hypothetical protein
MQDNNENDANKNKKIDIYEELSGTSEIKFKIGDLVRIWGDEWGVCGIGIILEQFDDYHYDVYWFDICISEVEYNRHLEVWDGTFKKLKKNKLSKQRFMEYFPPYVPYKIPPK